MDNDTQRQKGINGFGAFLGVLLVVGVAAGTIDRQPVTTSQLAKNLLTNETSAQMRSALGIGSTNFDDGGTLTNLNGAAVQVHTINSNAFDASTWQLATQQLASGFSTNIVSTNSNPGVSNAVRSISNLDPSAQSYADKLGLDDASRTRLNSFVRSMQAAGLWGSMSDGIVLRTNFNPVTASPSTLLGAYGTNHGSVTYDGAGAHTDGTNGWINIPITAGNTFTLVTVYCGATNAPGASTPFGLFNRSGTVAGGMYPIGNGNGEMRVHVRCTGADEVTAASTAGFPNGWYKLLTGLYYLECNDFRTHEVSMSYDNAGAVAGFVDNEFGLVGSSFVTSFTNGALNDVMLGAGRDVSGNATAFARATFQAAFLFNGVLTSNQLSAFQLCYRYLEAGTKTEWFIGDSETGFNFTGVSGEPGTGTDQSTNTMFWWPALLERGSEAFGWELGQSPYDQVRPVHMAMSGTKAVNWDNVPMLKAYFGNFGVGKGPTTEATARVWLGINDLGGDIASASTFYTHLTNIWYTCRNLGARVVAFTLPAVGSPFNSNAVPITYFNESLRAQYNSLIRSDPTKYDKLVDLDLIMTTNNMATNASPLLSYDGLHPTVAGHWLITSNIMTSFPVGNYVGNFSGNIGGINTSLLLSNGYTAPVAFTASLSINGVVLSNDVPLGSLTFKDGVGNRWGIAALSGSFSTFVQSVGYVNSDGGIRIGDSTGFRVGTGKQLLLSSTADANGSADAGIVRIAPGVAGISDGGAGLGWSQWKGESYLASDFTSTSTTLANTALSISVTTGRKYGFTCVLYVSDSTAADGVKVDFGGGSATASNFRVDAKGADTDTTTVFDINTEATSLATAITAASWTGSSRIVFEGALEPSGTGTFIVRAAQNAHSTGTLTVFRGSRLMIWDMP